MGPVSGRLRGTVRRGSAAGLAVLLAALLGTALPAAAEDEGRAQTDDPEMVEGRESHDDEAAAEEERGPEPTKEEREAEKEAAKAEKEAEKEAARAEKDAAKEEREAEKDAAKAEKEAEKEAARAEKDAAKAEREDEKEAAKAERHAQRLAAEPAPAPVSAPAAAAPAAPPPPAAPAETRRSRPRSVHASGPLSAGPGSRRARSGDRPRRTRGGERRNRRLPAAARTQGSPAAPLATAPVAAAPTAPAQGTPPPAERPREPGKEDGAGSSGLPITVVFDALSRSVAFVPREVWAAIGGLGLLALALLALALRRDRQARRLTREREALLADLRALEGAVVPHLPEALGGVALSATSVPAAGLGAGGDFHDAFALSPDRTAVIVGDVAGHGRQALADAQLVRHAVRAYLEAGLDPRGAVAMTGAVVDEREEPLFGSVLVAVHDRRDGSLTYAAAGHEPPVLVTEQGAGLPPVPAWSPPLGAGLETGRRQTRLPLPQGAAVCLVTDGLTEARSGGERVGLGGLVAWLNALGPGAMSSDVVGRLRAEADAVEEDVTVCMLRAMVPAAPGSPRVEEAIVEGGDPTYLVRFLRDCGLPRADAEEAGAALAAQPDGTRMVASVEVRGGRAVVELAPLGRASAAPELVS